MISPLHLPIPVPLWRPLAVGALVPLALVLLIGPLWRRRARGIATILTLHTLLVLSVGLAALAAVATTSFVHNGLRDLRERHAPAIRTLARELELTPLGAGGANPRIALALFRARNPSAAFVALGTDQCGADCIVSSGADDSGENSRLARELAAVWPDAPGTATLANINGRSLLLVSETLGGGAPSQSAIAVVGINAEALAAQATFTAWILLAMGYALLVVVAILSWRQLDRSLGKRIAAITRQIRAGIGDEDLPLRIDGNELSELADAVTAYIERTLQKQRSSEERYRRLVELAPDGILMCTKLAIKFANSAALALAGMRTRYDVIGHPIEEFLEFESMRAFEDPSALRAARWRRVDGSMIHVEVAEISDRMEADEMRQFMVRDVTERRRREAALSHRAEHDSLTGLMNRASFEQRLIERLSTRSNAPAAERSGCIAVLYLDLDGFKPVNDKNGHAAGDAVLVGVAARLRESARPADSIARLGGDEFAVLMHVREHSEAVAVAEQILESLTRPVMFGGQELVVGASIGIADSSAEESIRQRVADADIPAAAAELLRAADAAMYAAKRSGGQRIVEKPASQSLGGSPTVSFRDVA